MKKFILLAMTAVALTIFNGCQKEELNVDQLVDEVQPQEMVKPDVYVENGYLVFKSQEIFDSTLAVVQHMSDEEFVDWENSLNFVSANSFLQIAEKEYEEADTPERIANFREKYGDKLSISINFDMIDLRFYAKGLGDLLNIEGTVKIDKFLYIFTENKEYVILNGDKELFSSIKKDIPVTKSGQNEVVEFDPFPDPKLKSASEFLIGGEIYTLSGTKRLNYTFERSIFISATYLNNYQVTYNITHSLFFRMKQYTKNWLGNWKSDNTSYWVKDQYIDWNVGVYGDDTFIGNEPYLVWNPDPDGKIPNDEFKGTCPDKYFGTTNNSVYVYYTSNVFASTNPNYYFDVNSYSCKFRSNRMHDLGCSSCIFYEDASYQE